MRFSTLTAGIVLLAMGGCASVEDLALSSYGDTSAGLQMPAEVEYYPDDEVLRVAQIHFAEGNFGHAARYYERAVEVLPNDPEAWLGLAASYDRIRRFDLADRAYQQAAKYIGGRPEYYNNVGYSYLLRGDLRKARQNFLKAYEMDPENLTIRNNLDLLRDSTAYPKRG